MAGVPEEEYEVQHDALPAREDEGPRDRQDEGAVLPLLPLQEEQVLVEEEQREQQQVEEEQRERQ